ncbi:hypothetical protein ACF052_33130 [Streptomyces pilosus]|uniref:hypothetical protein n=1 Tax=Streptomyces pilosus TaxID=28893 RepID=UPI0036FE710E
MLFEVFKAGGAERYFVGERGDEGVLGGDRLRVADPAFQPGGGGARGKIGYQRILPGADRWAGLVLVRLRG